jgi:Mor family transcriptional regulator
MAGEQGFYDHLTPTLTVAARPVKPRRVRDRLTDDVQVLFAEFLAGTSQRELAKRYGLGLTAVKDLLRRHGVRRTLPS